MKINKLPKDTTAKNDGEIIYSEDGEHLQRISRQDFLKGYGGGGKGGDGGLQYFQETEHALTGSVRYNGLSDETLDNTLFNVQYRNTWIDSLDIPQEFDWGRVNGVVSGVAYTYGTVREGATFQYSYLAGTEGEGNAPTLTEYKAAIDEIDHMDPETGLPVFKAGKIEAFNYIFKKTNPGVTYFAKAMLPPRWTDYTEGSTHTWGGGEDTDWRVVTLMFCETEQPTYELYKVRDPEEKLVVVDSPNHPSSSSFSEGFVDAITEYIDTEDTDLDDLLFDDVGTHGSGYYLQALVGPVYWSNQYVRVYSGETDPIDICKPKNDSQVGTLNSPHALFDLTDNTKYELVASGSGANVIQEMGYPVGSNKITFRGKEYYVSYCYNLPMLESTMGGSTTAGGREWSGSFGTGATYRYGIGNFGDPNSFGIPFFTRLPYRGGKYRADGGYSLFSWGNPNATTPETIEQVDFGAESIIHAVAEAIIPTAYYSGLKRNSNTAIFVGAEDADGNNPAATVDILGNSTFNGGGGGGGTTEGISDVQLDGVSKKTGSIANITSGTGGIQRYLLKENRTTWDSTNLRWNTELVALPSVGDNSGDTYIPVPDAEFIGMSWGPIVNSQNVLNLGGFSYKSTTHNAGNTPMELKLGSHLTFNNTSQVLDADGFFEGADDIPVDGLWIKHKSVQGGGYELGFGALFSSNDFDVQTVGSGASAYPYIELRNPPVVYTAGAGINITNGVISATASGVYVQNKQSNCSIVPKGASSGTYTIAGIYPGGNTKPTGSIDILGTWELDAIVKIYTNQYQPATDDECIVLWLGNNYCSGADIDNQSYSHFDRPMTKIMLKDYVNDSYIYAHIHGIIENGTNAPIWVLGHNESLLNSQGGGTYAVLTGVTVAIRAYKIGTEESGISE